MTKKPDKKIEKLYGDKLNSEEGIYNQLNMENSEFRLLFRRAEEIETELLQGEKQELVEEYTKLHLKMQNIILQRSFKYGMKVCLSLVQDL